MPAAIIGRFAGLFAARTLFVRIAIVGGNFGVMLGLAGWLGLEMFGQIAVLWGLGMVAATVLSLGAPLMLLRGLSDGRGLTSAALWRQVLLYPFALATLGLTLLPLLIPGISWTSVILVGLAVNLVTCLASVMRALEDIQISMFLRDGAPQLALGLAAIFGQDAAGIVVVAAGILAVVAMTAMLFCRRHPRMGLIVNKNGDHGQISTGLWAAAILGMVAAQLDIIVGGAILRADEIGLYALLRRIANLVALPVSVATWVSATSVSAAFGVGDHAGLRRASAAGSRIALLPGIALFLGGLLLLPLLSLFGVPAGDGAWPLVTLVLLMGALIQVVLASGFTVATLCGCEGFAILARLTGLAAYLGIVGWVGVTLSAQANALAYVVGIGVGGLLLWALLWMRLAIDTSAAALWNRQGGTIWKLP